jgi:hypothetical protein
MTYDWYNIFNSVDFASTGLVSRNLDIELEGRGQKSIIITRGNSLGITVDGVFLVVGLNDRNPFSMDGMAVYVDDNNEVWLGYELED